MTELEILTKFGEQAIAEMVTRLQNAKHVNTGALKESLKYEITQENGKYKLTFSALDYAVYVDKGRKPGKFPPKLDIQRWVKKKFNPKTERQVEQLTFLVSRKIAMEGIAPTNFFSTTVTRKYPQLLKDLAVVVKESAVKQITDQFKTK